MDESDELVWEGEKDDFEKIEKDVLKRWSDVWGRNKK